jgi:hypothetical protein
MEVPFRLHEFRGFLRKSGVGGGGEGGIKSKTNIHIQQVQYEKVLTHLVLTRHY